MTLLFSLFPSGLQEPIMDEEAKRDQIDTIIKYFRLHRGTHGLYALR